MLGPVQMFSVKNKKIEVPKEPINPTRDRAIQWKPKYNAWNAVLEKFNASIIQSVIGRFPVEQPQLKDRRKVRQSANVRPISVARGKYSSNLRL